MSNKIIDAARMADWQQVSLNCIEGDRPCFHYEPERGLFCLRAESWAGHEDMHKFLSLQMLLVELLSQSALDELLRKERLAGELEMRSELAAELRRRSNLAYTTSDPVLCRNLGYAVDVVMTQKLSPTSAQELDRLIKSARLAEARWWRGWFDDDGMVVLIDAEDAKTIKERLAELAALESPTTQDELSGREGREG